MKFKSTILTIALALTLSLAGCNGDTSTPESDSTSTSVTESGNSSESSSDVSIVSSTFSNTSETQSTSSEPETKVLSRICYMRPVYKSTLDDPNWEETSPGDDYDSFVEKMYNWLGEQKLEPRRFFDVKEGDKLENGLTVKKIIVFTEADGSINVKPEIQFEGRLEMEGTLHVNSKDHDYFWAARDLQFFPDSNKNPYIPMWSMDDDNDVVLATTGRGAVLQADCTFQLGSIDDYDLDEDELFEGKDSVKVKLVVDNITVGNTGGDDVSCLYCFGHIVNYKKID